MIKAKANKYKFEGFTNVVTQYEFENLSDGDQLSRMPIAGAAVTDDNVLINVPGGQFVRSAWAMRFKFGGHQQIEVQFGPEQEAEFRTLLDMPMKNMLDDRNIIQGFPGILPGWVRFIQWNKKRQDWGLWDITDDDKFGDIIEHDWETHTVIFRRLAGMPTADHIAKAKAAGVMHDDFSIHCVFPRAYLNQPFDEVHLADKAASTENDNYVDHCASFYPKGNLQGYDAYANWHSLMKVKTANNAVHLGKRGMGKNYIIPMQDISVWHPTTNEDGDDGQKIILLKAGLPYKLVRNDIQVTDLAEGYILHIHEINTQ